MNIYEKSLNITKYIRKNYIPSPSGVYSRNARLAQYLKISITISRLKKKHLIIAIDAGKACHKIQHPFMIKSHEGHTLNLMSIYKTLQITLYLMVKNCFPPTIRNKSRMSAPTPLIKHSAESSSQCSNTFTLEVRKKTVSIFPRNPKECIKN